MSNSILGESPNFLDLGLSPANTADKIKSIFAPATRVEGFMDKSNWLASRHGCGEFTVGRVSEAKVFSEYNKSSKFETTKFFGRENNYVTRLNENIPFTRPTEFEPLIQPTEFSENEKRACTR